jgi:hypothetical protein
MRAPPLAEKYDCLTTEERFRLIMAAFGRGDMAEQDRLIRAGSRISCSMPDSAPYSYAFNTLAPHVFIDLLEEAARYYDAFRRLEDVEREGGGDEADLESVEGPKDDRDGNRPVRNRYMDLALASGYVLKAKAEGWKLFCERWNIPPFLLWEKLPGFDRLQRALELAEKAAFVHKGFLRWLNRIQSAGEPEVTEIFMTAEGEAEAHEKAFQQLVQWWSG